MRQMTLILWYSHLKLSQHINYLKYCFLTLKPMYSCYWISQIMGPEWTASTLKKFNGLWIKVVFLFFKINRYISSTNCFTFFTIFRCLGLSLLKSLFVCLFVYFFFNTDIEYLWNVTLYISGRGRNRHKEEETLWWWMISMHDKTAKPLDHVCIVLFSQKKTATV